MNIKCNFSTPLHTNGQGQNKRKTYFKNKDFDLAIYKNGNAYYK